jgi:hypothetical protein
VSQSDVTTQSSEFFYPKIEIFILLSNSEIFQELLVAMVPFQCIPSTYLVCSEQAANESFQFHQQGNHTHHLNNLFIFQLKPVKLTHIQSTKKKLTSIESQNISTGFA